MTLFDDKSPGNLDAFPAQLAYIRELGPSCETRSFSLDFSHAYKHFPTIEPHLEFATIVLADPNDTP